MTNTAKLISGTDYTLGQLFGHDRKIIIPDLQRDYCWGNKAHGDKRDELVTDFISALWDVYCEDSSDILALGLIYAYEEPEKHIQLCDGQQRLTTLFLLLGMLNKKAENRFRKNLISDFELEQDDKEPYLQYAIRESTLYFLSDLVCEFFLNTTEEKVSTIKQKDWYFKEYDTDPSIQSMLAALEIMEEFLEDTEDTGEFGDFILNQIAFLYYDMGGRQNGEETFVVINTTGEPLTATENLKPILLGKSVNGNIYGSLKNPESGKTYNEEWESREEFFWKNRKQEENTADEGLNQFMVWYWQIKLLQDKDWKFNNGRDLNPVTLFSKYPEGKSQVKEGENYAFTLKEWQAAADLNEVEKYFRAYRFLVELVDNNNRCSAVLNSTSKSNRRNFNKSALFCRQLPIHVLLPIVEFCAKYSISDSENPELYLFIRRLRKNHFDTVRDYRNGNKVDWRHILQIIHFSETPEQAVCFRKEQFTTFKNISHVHERVDNWFNSEEEIKSQLRMEDAQLVERWEDHDQFMGDLSSLINVYNYIYGADAYSITILDGLFDVYEKLDAAAHAREDWKLCNNLFLLSICYNYNSRHFWSQKEYYRAIERKRENCLHYESWFKVIWADLYLKANKANRWGEELAAFNKGIFLALIKKGLLNNEVVMEGVQGKGKGKVKPEKFSEFEEEITQKWHYGGDYTLGLMYTLAYFEIQAAEKLIKFPTLEQIGVRPFIEKEIEARNSFGNMKWLFHAPNSTYAYNWCPIFSQVDKVHKGKASRVNKLIEVNQLYELELNKSGLIAGIASAR